MPLRMAAFGTARRLQPLRFGISSLERRPAQHQKRDTKKGPRRRRAGMALPLPNWRTKPYGRNAAVPRRFGRHSVCRHIKLARADNVHGAIEDAWLAMQIYL
jgi:hypothetical protein